MKTFKQFQEATTPEDHEYVPWTRGPASDCRQCGHGFRKQFHTNNDMRDIIIKDGGKSADKWQKEHDGPQQRPRLHGSGRRDR